MSLDFLMMNAFAVDHLNHANEIGRQTLKRITASRGIRALRCSLFDTIPPCIFRAWVSRESSCMPAVAHGSRWSALNIVANRPGYRKCEVLQGLGPTAYASLRPPDISSTACLGLLPAPTVSPLEVQVKLSVLCENDVDRSGLRPIYVELSHSCSSSPTLSAYALEGDFDCDVGHDASV